MTRTASGPQPRETVRKLPAYVAGRRALSENTAALASNESHYSPLPAVLDVVARAAVTMNRYPDMSALALRERIASAAAVHLDEVSVGPGSVGVLQQILSAVCEGGDEVVFAWRSFEAYPILVSLAGARPIAVPLTGEEKHDFAGMAAAVGPRTKVVLVCAPNNPTGTPVEHSELRDFLGSVPSDVLVVIDEAYVEYVDENGTLDSLALFREHSNVCVLRTFSKAYGLAGLRVGYAIAHPEIAEGLRAAALPFGVSTVAQDAAIASLDAVDQIQERVSSVVRERHRVRSALIAAGWTVVPTQANFVWIRAGDHLREAIVAALASADVLVRGYVGDGVRITLGDTAANDRVLAVLTNRAVFGSSA